MSKSIAILSVATLVAGALLAVPAEARGGGNKGFGHAGFSGGKKGGSLANGGGGFTRPAFRKPGDNRPVLPGKHKRHRHGHGVFFAGGSPEVVCDNGTRPFWTGERWVCRVVR